MSAPIFETNRLILKEITLADVPSYESHFIDYEVIRCLHDTVPWPYPENGVAAYLRANIIPKQGQNQWNWGIFLKTDPLHLIGGVELWREAKPDNRGFWLGRQFWGQGLMTEAVHPIMNYAFDDLGFTKLIFSNALGNVRSRRIKEKTGATLLRVEPGKYVDPTLTQREIWELTKERWKEFSSKTLSV